MDLKTYHFENRSRQAKAVKVLGNFEILKAGESRDVKNCYPLDDAAIRNLAIGDLIVTEPQSKRGRPKKEEAAPVALEEPAQENEAE